MPRSDGSVAVERSPDGHRLTCGAAHHYDVPCTCDADPGRATIDRLTSENVALQDENVRLRGLLAACAESIDFPWLLERINEVLDSPKTARED